MASAAIVTIGNEIVSGDTENTNGSWLARRLAMLGVEVELIAAIPDEIDGIAAFVREHAAAQDAVVVTGGLGGTPDDLTREAIAAAFGVAQVEQADVAAALRARFTRAPEYAARWALLPEGSRPLENPLGGAPGFAIANVYVLPGLPAEMEAMFETIAGRASRRRADRELAAAVPDVGERDRRRSAGDGRPPPRRARRLVPELRRRCLEVEVVLKSADAGALAAAVAWIEPELDAGRRGSPPNGGDFRVRDAPMARAWPWVCAGAGTCFRS